MSELSLVEIKVEYASTKTVNSNMYLTEREELKYCWG